MKFVHFSNSNLISQQPLNWRKYNLHMNFTFLQFTKRLIENYIRLMNVTIISYNIWVKRTWNEAHTQKNRTILILALSTFSPYFFFLYGCRTKGISFVSAEWLGDICHSLPDLPHTCNGTASTIWYVIFRTRMRNQSVSQLCRYSPLLGHICRI